MYEVLRNVFFLQLWVHGALGTTTQIDSTSFTVPSTTGVLPTTNASSSSLITSLGVAGKAGNGTSPSRTINYITHTLPQQCLRTDRLPQNGTGIINSADASTTITSTTTLVNTVDSVVTGNSSSQVANNAGVSATTTAQDARNDATEASQPTASEPVIVTTSVSDGPILEEESESPLDNANFLSFEEWKKQNLEKLGQSPDTVGRSQAAQPNRPQPINNALDTLGEESEIDIDFVGFGSGSQPPESAAEQASRPNPSKPATDVGDAGNTLHRSKDAGKTCKERTNYASFDCSATVLKSNKELKSASSILVENKDSYALNTCSADNKFLIVELCDDIQVDTIVLANYEFFSSTFRHFRVSVSDRYPVKMEKWKELGTFEARNTREIQAFLVENPLIWAKYLRVEFLSQYGTEHFCPVSLLRVHGTTMIEDYRHQEDLARGEDDDEAALESEVAPLPPIAQEPASASDTSTVQAAPAGEETKPVSKLDQAQETSGTSSTERVALTEQHQVVNSVMRYLNETGMLQVGVYEPANENMTCENPVSSTPHMVSTESARAAQVRDTSTTADSAQSIGTSESVNSTISASQIQSTSPSSAENAASVSGSSPVQKSSDSSKHSASAEAPKNRKPPIGDVPTSTPAVTSSNGGAAHTAGDVSTATSGQAASMSSSIRSNGPSTSGEKPPQPSSQESFFKSFHKRLTQLESNSTLSLQYIEEQSRILRDAFSKVEKRQVGTTTKFLSQLNETVMTELHGFRQAYDQLWQSTVIELEAQRENYQREMLALSARLTMVADELVWQKRMGIVQSTLLLLCLALVLFGRNGNALEVPLMQQMMNRSTAALRAGWESPPDSPDDRSPVSLFRRKLWRASTEPIGETKNMNDSDLSRPQSRDGLNVLVEPPSPRTSRERHSDSEDDLKGEDSSPDPHKKTSGSQTSSPDRKRRKRPKKPPNWPQRPGIGPNGRAKSPLGM